MMSLLADLGIFYTEHPITMGAFTITIAFIAYVIIRLAGWNLIALVSASLAVCAAWYFLCRHLGLLESLS